MNEDELKRAIKLANKQLYNLEMINVLIDESFLSFKQGFNNEFVTFDIP